jgi:hypothetical protein
MVPKPDDDPKLDDETDDEPDDEGDDEPEPGTLYFGEDDSRGCAPKLSTFETSRVPPPSAAFSGPAARSIRVESRIVLFSFTLPLAQFGPQSGALLPGVVIAWSVWRAEGARTKVRPGAHPLPRCSLPWHRTPMGCSLPPPLPLACRQRATEEDPHQTSPRRSLNQAPTTRRPCPGGGGVISRA